MTSDPSLAPDLLYVWVWLPGHTEPVVAGVLGRAGTRFDFRYGASYRRRSDAIPLYLPELPLQEGSISPTRGLRMHGCLRDCGPDAWGQRVIMHRRLGRSTVDIDPADIDATTFLIESGSDRIGGLDFQLSPTEYVPRLGGGTLDELLDATERLEAGIPFSPAVDEALLHGSSVGGARPKALLDDVDGRHWIAKFASSTDPYPVVKAEAVAMSLAQRVGLNVAGTTSVESLGRAVLLVERFDRPGDGQRRLMVSALTILELDEMMARYATYHELADVIRQRFTEPADALRELFARITFNIIVGNTDDHARNHAAFWNGHELTLTPAFDICPQPRSGDETQQVMEIGRDGYRRANLAGCLDAIEPYALSRTEAVDIIQRQLDIVHSEWSAAADETRLTEAERSQMWQRQIVNPSVMYDWPRG